MSVYRTWFDFCSFVEKHTFCINYHFDCDSQGVIYLISCKKCGKQYVGSTITSFRYRFNNHKSSLTRFGREQRGICGEHLYSHFFSKGHSGLTDVSVPIIDKTDIGDPTTREGFWTHKLKCFTPLGLNIMDI